MRRSGIARVVTLGLAFVHTLPAQKHIAAFVANHSLADGCKGFGALVAVGLYLLPLDVQVRALAALWRRRQTALRVGGLALAAVHAIPAFDHFPRFLADGLWHDAWRGIGSALAMAWFAAPLRMQGRVLGAFGRLTRLGERVRSGQVFATRARAEHEGSEFLIPS
jgi:hypothetical protein